MAAEKLMPQNVEAESSMLGAILIDPEALDVVLRELHTPKDCYNEAHATILTAQAEYLESEGHAPDLVELCDELARRGKLDEVGGTSYVSSLANHVPTSRNARHYARIVAREAVLRRIINAAGQMAGVAYSEPDADAALEQAQGFIDDVVATFTPDGRRPGPRQIRAGLSDLIDVLGEEGDNGERHRGVVGVPTFNSLDRPAYDKPLLGGLRKDDLITLAARPAVGKTSLAISIAHRNAVSARQDERRGVLIFSLEMSEEELITRLLAMEARVDLARLRSRWLDDDEWARVNGASGALADAPVYIDDTPAISLAEVRARTRRAVAEWNIGLVVVDYLQLMSGAALPQNASTRYVRGYENRQQEVSAIARGLKNLAREMHVPVLALSQLSRGVEQRADKTPQLSDLRESGEIEQASDVVMFIKRDDEDRPNVADILVAKHRGGPTGQVSLYFEAACARYRDLEVFDRDGRNLATGEQQQPVPARARDYVYDSADRDGWEG